MTIINLGENIKINLAKLIDTRMLITANSGAGKSWAIRKLLEETHGEVQQIVLDIEGEFRTLREKYDYILIGKDGDMPTSLKSAELLAIKLLELKTSAIIDLYELKHEERKRFVKLFLNAMVNAPKELWHPCLVVVDEAHIFVPEKGESEASGAVIDLMTRGRKRGFCGIIATQRLSKLHKDAGAETNNKMIGRCSLDIDMKRGSEELGFTTKEQMRELRTLEAGEFFVFGTAISNEVKKGKVGNVQTTHPKAGSRQLTERKLPSSSKIKEVLQKLANLPQEAEKELKTKQDMQNEINRLKNDLRHKSKVMMTDNNSTSQAHDIGFKKGFIEAEKKYIKLIKNEQTNQNIFTNKLLEGINNINKTTAILLSTKKKTFDLELPKPQVTSQLRYSHSLISSLPTKWKALKEERNVSGDISGASKLREGAMRMLKAIVMFGEASREKIRTIARISNPTTFSTYIQDLIRNGWITEHNRILSPTQEGTDNAGNVDDLPTDTESLVNMWSNYFREGASRMLKIVVNQYPNEITREELQSQAEIINPTTFSTYLQELKRNGLIKLSGRNIKASEELFL